MGKILRSERLLEQPDPVKKKKKNQKGNSSRNDRPERGLHGPRLKRGERDGVKEGSPQPWRSRKEGGPQTSKAPWNEIERWALRRKGGQLQKKIKEEGKKKKKKKILRRGGGTSSERRKIRRCATDWTGRGGEKACGPLFR